MCRNLDLWFLLFYCLLSKFFFPPLFVFFLSVLLSFLLLSNWFLFLSYYVFPLLFRHCFIPVSLAHVVSSLAYPNLLGTKRLGCCYCCSDFDLASLRFKHLIRIDTNDNIFSVVSRGIQPHRSSATCTYY
jgi:hypothetical protein